VPGGGGIASHATVAKYLRSVHVRLSLRLKLCRNSVHMAFVSAVGQSASALRDTTSFDASHCLSSWPLSKVAPVSVTALMAASRELKPAWMRIDADRFSVLHGGDCMAKLEVGDRQAGDGFAVGRGADAYGLQRPRKPEDQSTLDELQRFRLVADGNGRERATEQPCPQDTPPIVGHRIGRERIERESEFADARDRGDRRVGVAFQDRGVGPHQKQVRFRPDGVEGMPGGKSYAGEEVAATAYRVRLFPDEPAARDQARLEDAPGRLVVALQAPVPE
jgi:hypothetical protein